MSFRPQPQSVPSVFIANECLLPALTYNQLEPVSICVGINLAVVVPSPNSESLFVPHAQSVLSFLIARTCEAPALKSNHILSEADECKFVI